MNSTLRDQTRQSTAPARPLTKTMECLAALTGFYVAKEDLPHCYMDRETRFGEQVMLERVAEIARENKDAALYHAIAREDQGPLLQKAIAFNSVSEGFDLSDDSHHAKSITAFLEAFTGIPEGTDSTYCQSFVKDCLTRIESACHELSQGSGLSPEIRIALSSTFLSVKKALSSAQTFSDFAMLTEQLSSALPDLIAAVGGITPNAIDSELLQSLSSAAGKSALVVEISSLLGTSKTSSATIAVQLKPGQKLNELASSFGLGQGKDSMKLLGQILSTAPELAREEMGEARSTIAREVLSPLKKAPFTDEDLAVLVGINPELISQQAQKRVAALSYVSRLSFRAKRFPAESTGLAPTKNPNIWDANKGGSALSQMVAIEQQEVNVICRNRGTEKIKLVKPKLLELYRAAGQSQLLPLCKDPAMVGAIILAFAEPFRETNGKREIKSSYPMETLRQRTFSVFVSLPGFENRFNSTFSELVALKFLTHEYPTVAINSAVLTIQSLSPLTTLLQTAKTALAPAR